MVLLVAASVLAPPAAAELRVCNGAGFRIDAALGFKDARAGWISQGWWHVEPGTCRVLITGRLTQRHYYLYGEGTGDHADVRFRGKAPFCITKVKFKLYQSQYGDNKQAACAEAGLISARFLDADTQGAPNHDFRLTYTGGVQAAGPSGAPPASEPAPVAPQHAPAPASGGGNAGSACQRFPNLC